tara:strand:- start:282 stop:518 length:237 start_codon:yes stop_codon:yes gene_type:complete
LHDGEIDAAQHVYDVDMSATRVEPNDRTKEVIARADELASSGRTMKLTNRLKQQGNAAALQEFQKMQKSGLAETYISI